MQTWQYHLPTQYWFSRAPKTHTSSLTSLFQPNVIPWSPRDQTAISPFLADSFLRVTVKLCFLSFFFSQKTGLSEVSIKSWEFREKGWVQVSSSSDLQDPLRGSWERDSARQALSQCFEQTEFFVFEEKNSVAEIFVLRAGFWESKLLLFPMMIN